MSAVNANQTIASAEEVSRLARRSGYQSQIRGKEALIGEGNRLDRCYVTGLLCVTEGKDKAIISVSLEDGREVTVGLYQVVNEASMKNSRSGVCQGQPDAQRMVVRQLVVNHGYVGLYDVSTQTVVIYQGALPNAGGDPIRVGLFLQDKEQVAVPKSARQRHYTVSPLIPIPA